MRRSRAKQCCLFHIERGCLLILLVFATAGGCGRGPIVAKVSGTVTYKSKPVAAAEIMFVPKIGKPAYGETDAEGKFEMFTVEKADGAIVGEHIVTIVKPIDLPPGLDSHASGEALAKAAKAHESLPRHYESAQTSPLRAKVEAGKQNHFDFELVD